MRPDTAFFSVADFGRRFLGGLASDLLSAVAAAAVLNLEERRARTGGAAEAPRSWWTSASALISAWRRSISASQSAIACAMTLMSMESSGPATSLSHAERLTAASPAVR